MLIAQTFIIAISLIIHQSHGQLKKCCPNDEVVQIKSFLDNDLTSHPIYSCAKIPHKNISAIDYPMIEDEGSKINGYSQSIEFIAYNTLSTSHSNWPSCGKEGLLSKIKLNEPTKTSIISSCVDLLDNSYYVFSCNVNVETTNKHDIYRLKKCCPSGMSYDIFNRMCIVNNVTDFNENFQEILYDKTVLFEHDNVQCENDDVLVEYHSNVHDLKMFEGSLVITNYAGYGPEVFNRNFFCIESTLNAEVPQPSGITSDHFRKKSTSKWIAKVCRNKDICSEIPCVRKCCQLGMRIQKTNLSSICVPHHEDITVLFHTFSADQENMIMNVVEPKGKLE